MSPRLDSLKGIQVAACLVRLLLVLALVHLAGASLHAAGRVRHRLIEGSEFIDDCPPCGRPTIPLRLRGTFDLELLEEDPLQARYALHDIDWVATDWVGSPLRLRGKGELIIGGEVALLQTVRLSLVVELGQTNIQRHFTNNSPGVSRSLPNVAADLTAEEKTFTQVFHVQIRSAPARDLWFVTSHGFTPGVGGVGPYRPAGEVLSMDGSTPFANRELTARLGVMPPVPPMTVDALDMLPGGEAVFTLLDSVFSETLGDLPAGTLVTSTGRIHRRLEDLFAPFGAVAGQVREAGIDAIHLLPDGGILFSPRRDVKLETGALQHGDVLGPKGTVRHRLKELIAAFEPVAGPGSDPANAGLDALHEWPDGEVWFSVSIGFNSLRAGPVHHGDLVSNRGWIVYRNLELLEAFQPLEDLADFGLEGVFVVTDLDVRAGPAELKPPRVGKSVEIQWDRPGRVFQLEAAGALTEGFTPASPILPGGAWVRPVLPAGEWFRVRSW